MKSYTHIIFLSTVPFIAACSASQPETSSNSNHTYLPVGAASPTQAMVNAGDTIQELKGFAVVQPMQNQVEVNISSSGGTIDLGDDWLHRDVTAEVAGIGAMESPDGFQGYEPNSNCLGYFCGFEFEQIATGTNGDRLFRRNEQYQHTYDYVMPFHYLEASEEHLATGFAGVMTLPDDVPTGFSAAFEGEAKFAVFNDQGDHYFDETTSSQAILEVSNGEVNLFVPEINGDTADNMSLLLNNPFKGYRVIGMEIDGNVFYGGTATALLDGLAVDPFSYPSNFQAVGGFYGYDQNLEGPDEAALMVNHGSITERLQIEILAD